MGISVMISSYVIPGVNVSGFLVAVVVAVILAVVNLIVKPIITLLTLPINIMTLGLFTLVINALMVLLVASVVPGFTVSGLLPAILFGVVLSLVSGFLGMIRE